MEASLWPVIVGGVIGITGSLATSVVLDRVKRKAERKSLTGAVLGEIAALGQIVERRRYIEGLRALIDAAKAGKAPGVPLGFQFSVRRNPFAVYDAHLGRLGMLREPLPRLITQFYAQASSILEDIADMREGKNTPRTPGESVQRLEQLLMLFEETRSLGEEILAKGRDGKDPL